MKKLLSWIAFFVLVMPTSLRGADASPQPSAQPAQQAVLPAATAVIDDFERDSDAPNALGGGTGSWNLNESDLNNSYCDEDIAAMDGVDGKKSKVLKLAYAVDSDVPSQNGFWMRLNNFDATYYDHLMFDVKGDPEAGFTDRFKIEIKKCKEGPCKGSGEEMIKGAYEVLVRPDWQTVRIPLNKMTGLINFSDPKAWEDAAISRRDLFELVVVFQDRHVSEKRGVLYFDNFRFVHTDNPGPAAVDFPPRKNEKTAVPLAGLEYAKFLVNRLSGFPKQVVVKKTFPEDDQAFIREVARDTWRFFNEIVDKEHALPLDTVQMGDSEPLGQGTWIGDYTNVTNIGVYLMALVSAYDLGFISQTEAVDRLRKTLNTVEKLEFHSSGFPYNYYDTTTLERTSYFVSLVDSAWLLAGLYVVKNAFPDELSEQAQRLLTRGNMVFFYDPIERQMVHGYYEHLQVPSDYHYGVFYTEPRIASYMAIAREEVPVEHWFGGVVRTFPESYAWQTQKPVNRVTKTALGRSYEGGYYVWNNIQFVPSWGGSAFEALMPALVLKEKELAPDGLGLNDLNHVLGQIHYSLDELKQPVWGMSPSSVPEGGYSEFGARPFGLKGYKEGVVTPHASVLALEFAPQEVVKNLRKLIELYEIYGEYGFYDAVTVATGKVARKYLALDQGMILIAINNYLNNGAVRRRFHSDPVMKNGEKLLTAEKFFDGAPPAPEPAPPAAATP